MDKVYTLRWTLRALIAFARLFNSNMICTENGDQVKLNIDIRDDEAMFNFELSSSKS